MLNSAHLLYLSKYTVELLTAKCYFELAKVSLGHGIMHIVKFKKLG